MWNLPNTFLWTLENVGPASEYKYDSLCILSVNFWLNRYNCYLNRRHCSRLDTLAFGLCQFATIWHFCYKYPQTPALSEHGYPPHFTAARYSFCSIPHGPASLAPNLRSDWLQNRHSDIQNAVFWPSGTPSWITSLHTNLLTHCDPVINFS